MGIPDALSHFNPVYPNSLSMSNSQDYRSESVVMFYVHLFGESQGQLSTKCLVPSLWELHCRHEGFWDMLKQFVVL